MKVCHICESTGESAKIVDSGKKGITTTANIIYTTKIIAQAKLHMQLNSRGTIIDRKLIGTSDKHN